MASGYDGVKAYAEEHGVQHVLFGGTREVDAVSGADVPTKFREGANKNVGGIVNFMRMLGNSTKGTEGMINEIVRQGNKASKNAKINE